MLCPHCMHTSCRKSKIELQGMMSEKHHPEHTEAHRVAEEETRRFADQRLRQQIRRQESAAAAGEGRAQSQGRGGSRTGRCRGRGGARSRGSCALHDGPAGSFAGVQGSVVKRGSSRGRGRGLPPQVLKGQRRLPLQAPQPRVGHHADRGLQGGSDKLTRQLSPLLPSPQQLQDSVAKKEQPEGSCCSPGRAAKGCGEGPDLSSSVQVRSCFQLSSAGKLP